MNGTRVIEARIRHGGRIVSRQYENVTPEQARRKAQREGRVISVRKVPLWDCMGTIERLNLNKLVSPAIAEPVKEKNWDGGVLLSDASLEEIVLGKSRKREERRKREEMRRRNGRE